MHDINQIYKMLHWHSSFGDQLQGIKLAKELTDLSVLILPCTKETGKAVWDNCARVLYEMSDDRLAPYLPSILEWIQDLNWPGALIILDRLKVFSGKILKQPFLDLYHYAVDLNNEEGFMWLDYLSELLDNENLKSQLPMEVLVNLQKHYKNWGAWWHDE